MVADHRAVLTRPAPDPDFTVSYGAHPDQVADLRLPAARGTGPRRPLIVVLHGGFWRSAWDRRHSGPLAADLASRGYPVAQLEYRRTGQSGGGWPGTFDDVAAGVAALPGLFAEAAGDPGIATDRLVLLGHSAGGQLALWCAAIMPDRVHAVVALAPVADLAEAYRLDLDGGAVATLLGGGPNTVPQRYAEADPTQRVPTSIRIVVIHGTLDAQVPIEMSRTYAAAARARGSDIDLIELPDSEHFALIDPRSLAWAQVTATLHSLCL